MPIQYIGAGRKAEVEVLQSHWNYGLSRWEVRLYVGEKVIGSSIVSSEEEAHGIAENFVYDVDDGDRVLLNE